MHSYSENWHLLKSILDGHATGARPPKVYSYTEHVCAKARATFLVHARLATPRLNRTTVEKVLSGELSWPRVSNTPDTQEALPSLAMLENLGLVAFYADWCTVHCDTIRHPDRIDPSLIPLLQAVDVLKNIRDGRNGFVQPHYAAPAEQLDQIFAQQFGSLPINQLLPQLRLNDGQYTLPPGNWSELDSTCLWHTLRETLTSEKAFEHWILYQRVNCEWAMPVLFNLLEFQERTEFNNQLLAYLTQDAALCADMAVFQKQVINSERCSSILSPTNVYIEMTINADGDSRREERDIEAEKPTLETLSSFYPACTTDGLSDLQLVRQRQPFTHGRELELFYTWLLANTVDASVRIERQELISTGFAEALLELAAARPILKHLLFNVLPEYESAAYKILLLSQAPTCDIAFLHLTQRSFISSRRERYPFHQHFDQGYQQLVCHEYLRAIGDVTPSGERLLQMVDLLGAQCALDTKDFASNFEYHFLECLLDNLSAQHVEHLSETCAQYLMTATQPEPYRSAPHYWYFLGFWLIERLEVAGIDPTGIQGRSLKVALLAYYQREFAANLAGSHERLQSTVFFSMLPWHKLIGEEGVSPLLALSRDCHTWQSSLCYKNENNLPVASAIRHYLQVLIQVGRPQRTGKDWQRVANRIVEIVRMLGFGSREQGIFLFDSAFFDRQYDLWTPFCSYTNLFPDNLYDDFADRCLHLIPLDQLFVLLECCTVIARTQQIQDTIATRDSTECEDLGLSALEQAFISACHSGHTTLAKKLIEEAQAFLSQERFAATKNPHITRARKVWCTYEYKWQLLQLLDSLKHAPHEFADAARHIKLPHDRTERPYAEEDRIQLQECDRFRRYIIAVAYCDTDPQSCITIMDALYRETNQSLHAFQLLKGRLALHRNADEITQIRHALAQFLRSIETIEPEDMPSAWITAILDIYGQLQDTAEIDAFWLKLSLDQQARIEVLRPYCLALIARGDALVAQQIIHRYRELNLQVSEGLGLDDLINELGKALPDELSMTRLIHVINEDSQRTNVQLTKHYSQIVAKDFGDYVAIVGQGQSAHEFLKNAVLEVAQELVLRKKNLQIHSTKSDGQTNTRITKEDLINDWFTSLFDKRMAEARIGMRDQKRGGESGTGRSPGEIDGYITSAKNQRVAIFEAFRLFSKNTTVISEHLDKIAGYDFESLRTVFIVAYCDVGDFDSLVQDYLDLIAKQPYKGFSAEPHDGSVMALHDVDQLWLGMERRRRNRQEVIFYHLLLNMNFHHHTATLDMAPSTAIAVPLAEGDE